MDSIYALSLQEDKAFLFSKALNGDVEAQGAIKALFRSAPLKMQAHNAKAMAGASQGAVKKIAVLSISGAIDYKVGPLGSWFGAVDVLDITNHIRAAIADPELETLILDWDSPGGGIFGVPELSDLIYEARNSGTRIISYLNPYALSAAYWLATAASEVYALPSGFAGSVGAYIMHQDISGYLNDLGLKVTFIKAGEKKTDGNGYEPLSESAKADLQKDVDYSYSLFVSHVARNRGKAETEVVRDFGKGSAVKSHESLAAGMVDGLLTLSELIDKESERIFNRENQAVLQDKKKFYTQAKRFIQTRRQ